MPVAHLASRLGYTEEQLRTTLQEVADSDQRDRGADLMRKAFDQDD